MDPTALLIIGYNGDEIVLATNVTPESARVVLTRSDAGGQVAVQATEELATPVFSSMVRLLSDLKASVANQEPVARGPGREALGELAGMSGV